MSKKIENPPWAPADFGKLLNHVRVATCGPDLNALGNNLSCLSFRMVGQIEDGRRNVTELETFYYLRALRDTAGERLDTVLAATPDVPPELLQLARETIPSTEDEVEMGYAMPPERLQDW